MLIVASCILGGSMCCIFREFCECTVFLGGISLVVFCILRGSMYCILGREIICLLLPFSIWGSCIYTAHYFLGLYLVLYFFVI